MKRLIIFFFLGLACTPPLKRTQTAITEDLVAYGKDPRQVMDLYLPKDRTPETPFVILIHGGAWTMADRTYVRDLRDSLFHHGIAVASINHRYADHDTVHYPEMLEDIERALSYCAQNATTWKTRKKGFSLVGASSGGHLALLYAYTTKRPISHIVAFSSPSDFTSTALLQYAQAVGLLDVIERMTGKAWNPGAELPNEYALASPITHIKKIPTLLVHGDKDPVVPYTQSSQLFERLQQQGIPSKLITIPGAGHDLKDDRQKIYAATIQWLTL